MKEFQKTSFDYRDGLTSLVTLLAFPIISRKKGELPAETRALPLPEIKTPIGGSKQADRKRTQLRALRRRENLGWKNHKK
jgi:hypothetical protein